ncbi:hypothetical protein A2Z33_02050 [Candidatus Gottesmanbacteria bacterium RBG_16_52_11]|uniref:Uncharacterized protein n=1 Tax=Candidatus Gottesmanbacteria bacterium RBG_16_52_11 TaxID=1798374 RepID=A0A1F5YRP6_9BACT|nr:MAG: hypothetical protein A2Z33_02050 [Candidatus Gottesmanbacteria bacterium RBG_16_52_11]
MTLLETKWGRLFIAYIILSLILGIIALSPLGRPTVFQILGIELPEHKLGNNEVIVPLEFPGGTEWWYSNIAIFLRHSDGWVIGPGETVSFNDHHGPYIPDNGYSGTGWGASDAGSFLACSMQKAGLKVRGQLPTEFRVWNLPEECASLHLYSGRADIIVKNPYNFPVKVFVTEENGRDLLVRIGVAPNK